MIKDMKVINALDELRQNERVKALVLKKSEVHRALAISYREGKKEEERDSLFSDLRCVNRELRIIHEEYGLFFDKDEGRFKFLENRASGRTRERHADHRERLYSL